MNRSLLLIAGWVGHAMAAWLSTFKRPLASEVAALHERLEKLRAENEILLSRPIVTLERQPGVTPAGA